MAENWFRSSVHHSRRSLDIVRMVVALILMTHSVHALMHPRDIRGFGHILQSHGFPLSTDLAWSVILLQFACSFGLLARRFVVQACLGHILILGMGIFLVHAPKWRAVGLPDGDHQPGAEFSVLLIACLMGVLWAHRRSAVNESAAAERNGLASQQGLELIRLAAPLILIIHPLEGLQNPTGLNDLGQYFSSIGYPFGVLLVWAAMWLQVSSCIALLLRRFVIPACLAHVYILCTGIWLFHAPHWFVIGPGDVVGPGAQGMEYSMLLIICFISQLLAYWPQKRASMQPVPSCTS